MGEKEIPLKELLALIVRGLVDGDTVRVDEIISETTLLYEIRVDKPDLGKIIGKKGKNAEALRTLMIALAAKQRKKAVLEIIE